MTIDPLMRRKGKQAPKLRCARCQTRLADPSRRVYSRFSKEHFCSDVDGCARRAARGQRKPVAA